MMLVPMFYTLLVYFYLESAKRESGLVRVVHFIFIAAAALLTVAYPVIPFLEAFRDIPMAFIIGVILFVLSAFVLFLMIRLKDNRLVLFAIVLIIGRIAFDWFVWPQRAAQYEQFEQAAYEIASITGDEKIEYYNAPMLQYGGSYYLTLAKWQIIGQEQGEPETGQFYIVDDSGLSEIRKEHNEVEVYYSYPNVEDGRTLYLIKITAS